MFVCVGVWGCVYWIMLVSILQLTSWEIKPSFCRFADFHKMDKYAYHSQVQTADVMSLNLELEGYVHNHPFNPVKIGLSWLQHSRSIFLPSSRCFLKDIRMPGLQMCPKLGPNLHFPTVLLPVS